MATRLEGRIARIRYTHPESHWTIATLRAAEGEVTVVGELPGLAPDMEVAMTGEWVESPKYGRQFQVGCFEERVPATPEGLAAYLGSGLAPGVGPGLAKRIVAAFGAEALEVIRHQPERLRAVKGLGTTRAERLTEALEQRHGQQEALVFLHGLGLGTKSALRVYERHGPDTVRLVRANPYRLAEEVRGIGFRRADELAAGVGIAADHPARLRAAAEHVLKEARDEGHTCLPQREWQERSAALVAVDQPRIAPALAELARSGRVVLVPSPRDPADASAYLPALYDAEREVARRLGAVAGDRATPDAERVSAAAARLGMALAPAQHRALEMALGARLSILTGGPGTGKTTIVRALCEAARDPGAVLLAAPTGRAAKRLAEATGREAKTLHRLLEFSPSDLCFGRDEEHPLAAERVVVDEASMVDLPLFAALVRALAPGTALVLVGDADQLPPVGPGSPFLDLIESGRVPVARLTEIFRQGPGSAIVEIAHRFNQGIPPAPTPPGGTLSDFYFVERDSPETAVLAMEELVCRRIPQRFGFDPRSDIQILAPMKSGILGVDQLNRRFQALLNPAEGSPEGFRVGDKVMQTRNDYDRGIFNGDLGIVTLVEGAGGRLLASMDGREVPFTSEQLADLVLAYAISVHKSQGSEYRAVVMPVSTQHYRMLERNLVYTGITRGRELVVLVGTERALRIAAGREERAARHSWLAWRLDEACRLRGGA